MNARRKAVYQMAMPEPRESLGDLLGDLRQLMNGIALERIGDTASAPEPPEPMERSTEDLRQEIEAKKEDIADQARNRIGSQFRRPSAGGALKAAGALVTKAATAYLRNKLSRAFKGRNA